MLEMVLNSARLFFAGKLFADNAKVYSLVALGMCITAAIVVIAAKAGLPIWAAAGLGGFLGGMLQPRLFKNLRYR
jgi:hypothetical protein